ncbi:prolipoprotein diacylglyceryl transferase [Aliidiomarina iranensis]|uniref:Phosphatidylglycerol--prolipoprotein diacylglyceryl transferase n=1 Tax=Aliidiomarina iranensis TaxID=1434071 RepID=A0A432W362_9GAMM|nr:prolipoprotein diacylglyceryl transferase [Aliidiomarina iranensis]RUO23603.1 prolipoprotein diacylglyceryl transferase [Aliidiomarina iranensis]
MNSDFLQFPNWDPVAISIGPLSVHWYGIMYLVGAVFAYWWGSKRAAKIPGWEPEEWQDLLFWGFLALILGGRLGYFLFYQSASFFSNPLVFFQFSQGGMSFHGGLLGVLIALFLFAIKHNRGFLQVGDFVAPLVPVGLGAGRIGNFINGELWGRVTDVPWAMVFPNPASGLVPRHPSQLYQAATEGLLLFLLLWAFSRKPRPVGAISGLFLLGYGSARMTTEFFREPDAHLGILGIMSMGQWLSLPMIIVGAGLMILAYQGKFGGMQPLPEKPKESSPAGKSGKKPSRSKKKK